MKKYFVVSEFEGETFMFVKTERELAEHIESRDIGGVSETIKAYEYVDGELKQVDADEIATAYLSYRDDMQREYEEYTEYIQEYGY